MVIETAEGISIIEEMTDIMLGENIGRIEEYLTIRRKEGGNRLEGRRRIALERVI